MTLQKYKINYQIDDKNDVIHLKKNEFLKEFKTIQSHIDLPERITLGKWQQRLVILKKSMTQKKFKSIVDLYKLFNHLNLSSNYLIRLLAVIVWDDHENDIYGLIFEYVHSVTFETIMPYLNLSDKFDICLQLAKI